MNPGADYFAAAKWITSHVGNLAGAVSGTFLDLIPLDVSLPAVRFHMQSGSDKTVVSGERVLVTMDWLVVVVNEGLAVAPVVPIAAALDVALHKQKGPADNYLVECVRREPFSLIEPDDSGVQMRHAGGIYRTIVGPT